MRAWRWAITGVGALVLAGGFALAATVGWVLFGSRGPIKTQPIERGSAFRLVVDVLYKGAPIKFDVVVGCNIAGTKQIDRSVSIDFVGTAPFVYGLKMTDGAGLVVRPPSLACNGYTTASGKVPANFMPLLIVYEDAEKPTFGLAYASDDAYESPISVLKFISATITTATRDELLQWRKTEAGKNIVKKEHVPRNLDRPFGDIEWTPGKLWFGNYCAGMVRLELPRPLREAVRPFWQEASTRYWIDSIQAETTFREAGTPYRSDGSTGTVDAHLPYASRHFARNSRFSFKEAGVVRKDGSGTIIYEGLSPPGEILPSRSEMSLNNRDISGLPIRNAATADRVTIWNTLTDSKVARFPVLRRCIPRHGREGASALPARGPFGQDGRC